MADVVHASRTTRTLAITAACITAVAGFAGFAATRADAAPAAGAQVAAAPATSTGDITMTAAANTALRGDSGGTFYVDSYAWGVSSPSPRLSSGASSTRPADQTLTLSRPVGPGSPALLNVMAAGRRLGTVELAVNARTGARTYAAVSYRLQNCAITDIKQGADADGKATEKVGIVCETTAVTTRTQLPNGQLSPDVQGRITSTGPWSDVFVIMRE